MEAKPADWTTMFAERHLSSFETKFFYTRFLDRPPSSVWSMQLSAARLDKVTDGLGVRWPVCWDKIASTTTAAPKFAFTFNGALDLKPNFVC